MLSYITIQVYYSSYLKTKKPFSSTHWDYVCSSACEKCLFMYVLFTYLQLKKPESFTPNNSWMIQLILYQLAQTNQNA